MQNNEGYNENLILENNRLKEEIKQLRKSVCSLQSQNKFFFEENVRLGVLVDNLKFQAKTNNSQKFKEDKRQDAFDEINIDRVQVQQKSPAHILYADAIVDDLFYHVSLHPNKETVYELSLESASERKASFTVYEQAYRRVLKNPDFVDGCIKQKVGAIPNVLEVEIGKAVLDDHSKWRVTQKAKIKFI